MGQTWPYPRAARHARPHEVHVQRQSDQSGHGAHESLQESLSQVDLFGVVE